MKALNNELWGTRLEALWIVLAVLYASIEEFTKNHSGEIRLSISSSGLVLFGFLISFVIGHSIYCKNIDRLRTTLLVAFGATTFMIPTALKYPDKLGAAICTMIAILLITSIWRIKDKIERRTNNILSSIFVVYLITTICSLSGFLLTLLYKSITWEDLLVIAPMGMVGLSALLICLIFRDRLLMHIIPTNQKSISHDLIWFGGLIVVYGYLGTTSINANSFNNHHALKFWVGVMATLSFNTPLLFYLRTKFTGNNKFVREVNQKIIYKLSILCALSGLLFGSLLWLIRYFYLKEQISFIKSITIEISSGVCLGISLGMSIIISSKIILSNKKASS